MEEGDRRDTVRNSVYNPDCSFYHMLQLQSHIYLSEESRHCRQGLNLKPTFQTQLNRAIRWENDFSRAHKQPET